MFLKTIKPTNMQQLTAAIAAKYYGAQVLHTNSAGYKRTLVPKAIYEDSFIDGIHLRVLHTAEHNVYFIPIAHCQLLLTPLSRITDEDAIFIYETIIGKPIGGDRYSVTRNPGKSIVIESVYNIDNRPEHRTYVYIPDTMEIYYTQDDNTDYPDGVRMMEITDYLRSSTRPDGTPKPAYDLDNLINNGPARDVNDVI